MPRREQEPQKTRTLRRAEQRAKNGVPVENAQAIGALVEVLAQYSRGVYVSQANSTGGVRLKVYGGEEAIETYLAANDDPEEVLGELAEEAAGPIVAELWGRAWAARRAERAADPSRKGREGKDTTPTPPRAS